MSSESRLAPGHFHFRYVRRLGQGGLGHVDEIEIAETSHDGYRVGSRWACKHLNAKWNDHPMMRERFEREIMALKSMSHPAIVRCKGESLAGRDDRFYLMPIYPSSLRQLLVRHPKGFDFQHAIKIGIVIAEAMSYAHDLGFLHRDIKPENILLDKADHPVIADWGLGYFVHKSSVVMTSPTESGLGTAYYCSIDQWNTGKCDRTADIYSLGMMLAELVQGSRTRLRHVGAGIETDVLTDYSMRSRHFNQLIRQMTFVAPTGRIASMHQIATELRSLAER